jgi:hypothetical protein
MWSALHSQAAERVTNIDSAPLGVTVKVVDYDVAPESPERDERGVPCSRYCVEGKAARTRTRKAKETATLEECRGTLVTGRRIVGGCNPAKDNANAN